VLNSAAAVICPEDVLVQCSQRGQQQQQQQLQLVVLTSLTVSAVVGLVESSESASQANTVEMVNTPMFVDDMMYAPYDQRSMDDTDDYKPPYNVRTRNYQGLVDWGF